jgi:hypothetical protein
MMKNLFVPDLDHWQILSDRALLMPCYTVNSPVQQCLLVDRDMVQNMMQQFGGLGSVIKIKIKIKICYLSIFASFQTVTNNWF